MSRRVIRSWSFSIFLSRLSPIYIHLDRGPDWFVREFGKDIVCAGTYDRMDKSEFNSGCRIL
jgi:hypothetical protein